MVRTLTAQSAGYKTLAFSFRRLQRRLVVTLRRCERAISSSVRVVIGVASLPLGMPVELEVLFEVAE